MIECQKPMMIDTARKFEQLIKNPKGLRSDMNKDDKLLVTWDTPNELEVYIKQLESITERLTTENRRLRKCHNILIEKVGKCVCV